MQDLGKYIRDIPDFPKPGIVFKDITPLLENPSSFRDTIDLLSEHARNTQAELILGIESRGFIFGSALAYHLGLGLVIARKPGKLPYQTHQVSYDLEYGSNCLEMHVDSIPEGNRVLIVDDLLATGGTAAACAELVSMQQGIVAGYSFVVELAFLKGRDKLEPYPVHSLLTYP